MQRIQPHSTKFRPWQTAGKLIVLLVFVLSVIAQSSRAVAQSTGIKWSAPENLSNTPQSSASPAIIADDYGYVHVFWSEDVSGSAHPIQADSGNTIYYTQWDGTSWTPPMDILFVPDDPIADQISVAIDKQGFIHLVWTGLVNIYYSKARATEAGSAQAWLTPVVITPNSARTSLESSVAVDDNGNAHIIYAARGDDPGVYHVESSDGETWGEPQKLSEPFDPLEGSLARVKIIADSGGRLHSVWQTSEVNGYGQAIYYTRSTDQGKTWATPKQMAYRQPGDFDVGWPYIMAVGPSEIHLIYNGGSTVGSAGRYEYVSTDGGETWSAPQHIITDMIGINGYVIPVVDGAGQLHLIINMRPEATQIVGIYYSSWLGDSWSPVVPIVNDMPATDSAHYTSVAVVHGNEIHIVWNQIRGGEIWHVRGVVQNVAPAQVDTVPTTVPALTPEPTAALISVRPAQSVSATVNSALTTTALNSASNSPLVPAVTVTVVAILVMAVVWRVRRGRTI
jgi:hypothetical protein